MQNEKGKPMFLFKRTINPTEWYDSDQRFNQVYPSNIRTLSVRHWTPLKIARKAAGFLSTGYSTKILDVGSGVGKFCLSAGYFCPQSLYYGIEQRRSLVRVAETAKKILGSGNVSFLHGNFTQLDFRNFDHFYFYNSFYENLAGTEKIDESIDYSPELYHYYTRYLFKQLERMPAGTRFASYHSLDEEVPADFRLVYSEFDSLLKGWIKQ